MNTVPIEKRWHSVALVATGSRCDAVQAIDGQRFLSREAPRIPLSDCAHPETCGCTYQHYEDRRVSQRRARATPPTGDSPDDRRHGRGRRLIDRWL